jgi:hypothetical protein
MESCSGKVRHRNQAAAKRAAHDASEKYQETLLPYFCPNCGGWHIGHPQQGILKTYHRDYKGPNRREKQDGQLGWV